jgi:hypothetical protein
MEKSLLLTPLGEESPDFGIFAEKKPVFGVKVVECDFYQSSFVRRLLGIGGG